MTPLPTLAAARFARWLPRLVMTPIVGVALLFIYGLIAWNAYLSLSASRLLPTASSSG